MGEGDFCALACGYGLLFFCHIFSTDPDCISCVCPCKQSSPRMVLLHLCMVGIFHGDDAGFFYIFYPMGSLCPMMYHYDLIDPLFLQKKTVCLYLLPEILGLFIKMYYLTVLKQFVLIFYLIFQSR